MTGPRSFLNESVQWKAPISAPFWRADNRIFLLPEDSYQLKDSVKLRDPATKRGHRTLYLKSRQSRLLKAQANNSIKPMHFHHRLTLNSLLKPNSLENRENDISATVCSLRILGFSGTRLNTMQPASLKLMKTACRTGRYSQRLDFGGTRGTVPCTCADEVTHLDRS